MQIHRKLVLGMHLGYWDLAYRFLRSRKLWELGYEIWHADSWARCGVQIPELRFGVQIPELWHADSWASNAAQSVRHAHYNAHKPHKPVTPTIFMQKIFTEMYWSRSIPNWNLLFLSITWNVLFSSIPIDWPTSLSVSVSYIFLLHTVDTFLYPLLVE